MTASYAKDSVEFRVRGAVDRSYAVTLTTTGGVTTSATALTETAGPSGNTSFTVPVSAANGAEGTITAELAFGLDAAPLQTSASLWLAPTQGGGHATGSSQWQARIGALTADHLTPEGQRAAYQDLTRIKPQQQAVALAAPASGRSRGAEQGQAGCGTDAVPSLGMAMSLRLTDAESEALRRKAAQEGRSMQEVARAAIAQYVSERPQRLTAAIGRVRTEDGELLERLSR